MVYERVLALFRQISQIPRGSGNTRGIADFIRRFAEQNFCSAEQDEAGNVFVVKEAAAGYEQLETLVFQAHMDMVCVADRDAEHNFTRDPIQVEELDGWLYAPGTTLGADDGLGVAIMLGLIEDKKSAGRLEFIFTADEETNMTGAKAFDCRKLTGRKIINLDNEKEGSLIVSSAGITDLRMQIPYDRLKSREAHVPKVLYELRIDGFLGGHSGMDIHLPRLNAVQVVMGIVMKLRAYAGFRLYSVTAGSHMNAIPKSAACLFSVEDTEDFENWLEALQESLRRTEPKAVLHLTPVANSLPLNPYTQEGIGILDSVVTRVRHGVLAWDQGVPDLVETSMNLARLVEAEDCFEIWCCFRSSAESQLQQGQRQLELLAEEVGASVMTAFYESGWQRNLQSTLVPYVVRCYRETLGEEPRVEGIHAGLECGCWSRGLPEADIVSLGPTLVHPHTTGERAELSSLEKYVRLTDALVRNAEALSGSTGG